MTAIVGILCSDGVVVGCDSSATFTGTQILTIEQRVKKLDIIGDRVIVAGTGQIGLGQRFCGIVKQAHEEKVFQVDHLKVGVALSKAAIANFAETQTQVGQYGALVAYTCSGRFFLCEFATRDFQPEFKSSTMWFVSVGSGQTITDPFLGFIRRVFWKDSLPSVAEGIFFATWTLQHVIDLNVGGINAPIQMAVIRTDGKGNAKAEEITDAELQEHQNNVGELEKYLSDYKRILKTGDAATIPQIKK